MPSIPQSLLWISLVVLWLFVLVPMLINKRDTVRRTSDVALATRVLNGGARAARLIKRGGPGGRPPQRPGLAAEDEDEVEEFDEDEPARCGDRQAVRVRSVVVVTSLAEEDRTRLSRRRRRRRGFRRAAGRGQAAAEACAEPSD